jgi:dTDP-4-dehydrorhamnose reductase
MKLAITGASGMLGTALSNILDTGAFEIITLNKQDLNIYEHNNVKNFFKENSDIKYLINCAAYTDVPKAETDRDLANRINNYGCHVLAKNCLENNIHLIHFSTDFVFDGSKNEPYLESDRTNPLNMYGITKLLGENSIQNVMSDNPLFTIFRVQWLFGNTDKHFFKKIVEKYKEKSEITLVDDEFGSPCSVDFVSSIVLECLENDKISNLKGEIVNLTHDNFCSRYECGKYFLSKFNFDNVKKISGLEDLKMKRPKYGVLDNSKIRNFLNRSLGTWENDLDVYFNNNFKEKDA